MTEIRLAPIAYLISTRKKIVRTGVTIMPPPKPVSEPIKPARREAARTIPVNSAAVNTHTKVARTTFMIRATPGAEESYCCGTPGDFGAEGVVDEEELAPETTP